MTEVFHEVDTQLRAARLQMMARRGWPYALGIAAVAVVISLGAWGLNAYQHFTGVGQPLRDTARFNQYGGSLGGPILKNRIFAFFAYESSPNSSTSCPNTSSTSVSPVTTATSASANSPLTNTSSCWPSSN